MEILRGPLLAPSATFRYRLAEHRRRSFNCRRKHAFIQVLRADETARDAARCLHCPRRNALAFGVLIAFLVITGSVWIISNLDDNMMPMPTR